MQNVIRQAHRWSSVAFTVMVIANLVALGLKSSAHWIGFLALVPLLVLLPTRLYSFVLPHVRAR